MKLINNFYDPYDNHKISLTTIKLIEKYEIRYLLYTVINLLGINLTIKNTNLILYNDKEKFDILIFTDNITLIIKKIIPILDDIKNVIITKLGNNVKFIKKGLKVKKNVITLCCNENDECFLKGYELFLYYNKDILLYIKIIESFIDVKLITTNYNDNVKLLNVKGIYLFMNMYYSYKYHMNKLNFKDNIKQFRKLNKLSISFSNLQKLHVKVFRCKDYLVNFLKL